MFFRKKPQDTEAIAKKGIKKMDAVVTGAILWGIVASLYGVKKLQHISDEKDTHPPAATPPDPDPLPPPEKKPGFFSRLFRRKK